MVSITTKSNTSNSFIDLTLSKKSLNSSSRISMTSVINFLIFVRMKQPRMNCIKESTLYLMNFGKLLRIARNNMWKSAKRSWKVVGLNTN